MTATLDASPSRTSAYCITCTWESRTLDAPVGARLHLGLHPTHTVTVVTSQLMRGEGAT